MPNHSGTENQSAALLIHHQLLPVAQASADDFPGQGRLHMLLQSIAIYELILLDILNIK